MSESHWDKVKDCHRVLSAVLPALFDLDNPVPFAKGIREKIEALFPEIDKSTLNTLLWWLTRRRAYLIKCVPGARRFGLDGYDGVVSESDAAFAARLFAIRDAKARDKWADRVKEAA